MSTVLIAALVGGVGSNMGGDTWKSFKGRLAVVLARSGNHAVDDEASQLEEAHIVLVQARDEQSPVEIERAELAVSERIRLALAVDSSCEGDLRTIAREYGLVNVGGQGTVINNNTASGGGRIASGYNVTVTFESGRDQ